MTQKEMDLLKIRVGAARGALTILSDNVCFAPPLSPEECAGLKETAEDAIKNLNLACDILESKT